jgi:hypothetical protein
VGLNRVVNNDRIYLDDCRIDTFNGLFIKKTIFGKLISHNNYPTVMEMTQPGRGLDDLKNFIQKLSGASAVAAIIDVSAVFHARSDRDKIDLFIGRM